MVILAPRYDSDGHPKLNGDGLGRDNCKETCPSRSKPRWHSLSYSANKKNTRFAILDQNMDRIKWPIFNASEEN